MLKIYGISAAMFTRRPSDSEVKLPITVVSGSKPDDIRVETTSEESFDINSRHRTNGALGKLFDTIRSTTQTSTEKPIIVVFGYPLNGFNVSQVIRNANRDLKPKDRLNENDPSVALTRLFELKAGVGKKELHLRGFAEGAHVNNLRVEDVVEDPGFIQLNERLLQLKVRLDMEDVKALEELEQIARVEAEKFVDGITHIIQTSTPFGYSLNWGDGLGDSSSRFFMTAPRSPRTSELAVYNFIAWHPRIRAAFTDVMCKRLNLRHNFVLKAPCEPPGRPFFDVLRAYLLDEIAT